MLAGILLVVGVWVLVMVTFHIGRRSVIRYPLGFLDGELPKRPNVLQRFVVRRPYIAALIPAMLMWALVHFTS